MKILDEVRYELFKQLLPEGSGNMGITMEIVEDAVRRLEKAGILSQDKAAAENPSTAPMVDISSYSSEAKPPTCIAVTYQGRTYAYTLGYHLGYHQSTVDTPKEQRKVEIGDMVVHNGVVGGPWKVSFEDNASFYLYGLGWARKKECRLATEGEIKAAQSTVDKPRNDEINAGDTVVYIGHPGIDVLWKVLRRYANKIELEGLDWVPADTCRHATPEEMRKWRRIE